MRLQYKNGQYEHMNRLAFRFFHSVYLVFKRKSFVLDHNLNDEGIFPSFPVF